MLPRLIPRPLCQQRRTGPINSVQSKMNETASKVPDIRPQKPKTIGVLLERWEIHQFLQILMYFSLKHLFIMCLKDQFLSSASCWQLHKNFFLIVKLFNFLNNHGSSDKHISFICENDTVVHFTQESNQ